MTPPLSLDSDGDIVDAEGNLLAVTTGDGKKIALMLIEALGAINLLRDLSMETAAGVALEYIGADTWQVYDTLNCQPIADGETPLQAMQAAKKVLTEVTT